MVDILSNRLIHLIGTPTNLRRSADSLALKEIQDLSAVVGSASSNVLNLNLLPVVVKNRSLLTREHLLNERHNVQSSHVLHSKGLKSFTKISPVTLGRLKKPMRLIDTSLSTLGVPNLDDVATLTLLAAVA